MSEPAQVKKRMFNNYYFSSILHQLTLTKIYHTEKRKATYLSVFCITRTAYDYIRMGILKSVYCIAELGLA